MDVKGKIQTQLDKEDTTDKKTSEKQTNKHIDKKKNKTYIELTRQSNKTKR